MTLTDTACRNAKPRDKAYKLSDGGGLHLLVRPTGKKVFQYRFESPVDGDPSRRKEGTFTIGEFVRAPAGESDADAQVRRQGGGVTLAEARAERDRARALARQGTNPIHDRQLATILRAQQVATTFELVAAEWVSRQEWEPHTKRRRLDTLQRVAFPTIGALPIADVASAHILHLLLEISTRNGPAVAAETRRSMNGIFNLAVATLRAGENPVERVKGAIKSPKSRHKRPLPPAELGELMRDLTGYERNYQTVAAFRLMWWTLCRPNEAVGAEWSEFDLDAAVWTISGERVKLRRPHRVSLPAQAISALQAMHGFTGHRTHVFPHRDQRDQPMTQATLRQALYYLGWKDRYTPYATRTTGSTILNELGYPPDWIERQLDHDDPNKVRESYNRAEYFEDRRGMIQHWADLLDGYEASSVKAA